MAANWVFFMSYFVRFNLIGKAPYFLVLHQRTIVIVVEPILMTIIVATKTLISTNNFSNL